MDAAVSDVMRKVAVGVIRHVLTSGGGALVAAGYMGSGDVDAAVGAVLVLVGVVWSAIEKHRTASAPA